MANFYSMFGFLAVSSFGESEPGTFDMLSRLPIEMALTVLGLLPAKDLLNAVLVSKKWLKLCKSDPKLRQKVRRYLRQMRRTRLATLMGLGTQARGRVRNSPVMGNVTNAGRNNRSRLRENGVQLAMSGGRLPLPYQRNVIEKPKKCEGYGLFNQEVEDLTDSGYICLIDKLSSA